MLAETSQWVAYLEVAKAVAMTVFGLGLLIFVHELGHFAVAKMCGVKCERFFLGFDVPLGRFVNWLLRRPGEFSLFGLRIPRTIGPTVKVGETTYGIGILPLGGYVGMLGQNDDPRMSEEQIRESQLNDGSDPMKEIVGPNGEKIMVNARSYIAKSVPQKMAIISAGVVMNVIFAFLLAVWAFELGVPSQPCILSGTDPGAPAWVSGLQPGDRVVRINGEEVKWFDELRNEVTLSGEGDVVKFEIERPGTEGTVVYDLAPSRERFKLAQVGAQSPRSLELIASDKPYFPKPYFPFSPAADAEGIPSGATVVAVARTPVADYREYIRLLMQQVDQPLEFTFKVPPKEGEAKGETKQVTIAPNPREHTGLVMKMSPIDAIQVGSPAEAAGLQVGDRLLTIDEIPVGVGEDGKLGIDPALIDFHLLDKARKAEAVILTILRPAATKGAADERLTLSIAPQEPLSLDEALSPKSAMAASTLGIAYYLTNEIDAVLPGTPASQTDLKAGERIVSVKFEVPKEDRKDFGVSKKPLKIDDEQPAMAFLVSTLQDFPPGLKLHFMVADAKGGEPREVTVGIAQQQGVFTPERGLALKPIVRDRQGSNLAESASMAWTETGRSLTSVYRFLYRLTSGGIPVRAMGGPVTIARASYLHASQGFPTLLLFLTLISANLAVVNFLPIPVLDGGHMAFLAYEGITGRPPNENIAQALTMVGLGLILCLMIFVFGLDLGLIDRNL